MSCFFNENRKIYSSSTLIECLLLEKEIVMNSLFNENRKIYSSSTLIDLVLFTAYVMSCSFDKIRVYELNEATMHICREQMMSLENIRTEKFVLFDWNSSF